MAASIRREFGAPVAAIEDQRLGRGLSKYVDPFNVFFECASVAGVNGHQALHTVQTFLSMASAATLSPIRSGVRALCP